MLRFGAGAIAVAVLAGAASLAAAATVSYSASFTTSKGNPVSDILILESDAEQQVHATIYSSELPGVGTSAVSHDVAFAPVKTLIIGLTEGKDADGNDHTQIVMFLDSAFAATHAALPFSSIFQGARHSTTISNLQAAVAGDAAQLSWFTDTFFTDLAAGAAFDSFGQFTVAEFTSLTIAGVSAVFGNWMINSMTTYPVGNPNTINGRATQVLDETAKSDTGPFDIKFSLSTHSDRGQLAIDKTVLNNTGVAWREFDMELGTGSGAGFLPSTSGDGFYFVTTLNNRETTGAFPGVVVSEDRIVFTGLLPPGGTAHFVVFVGTTINDAPMFTLRQRAATLASSAAPALSRWSLAVLALLLCGLAMLRLRTPAALRG